MKFLKIYKFLFLMFLTWQVNAQKINDICGSYQKIDSTGKYKMSGETEWRKDIDTTLLTLNQDMTFSYKWSPMFGPSSHGHLTTTGTWQMKNKKIVLNSKYQDKEYRVIEDYKPEYGDSLVKVYVQTYDSLASLFYMAQIAIKKDTFETSEFLFQAKNFSTRACLATFKVSSVDKIALYGEFGRSPIVKPKNKKSNFFFLQYNLSTEWDYQYLTNYKAILHGNTIVLNKKSKIILTKL
jgi:hypothetical protein